MAFGRNAGFIADMARIAGVFKAPFEGRMSRKGFDSQAIDTHASLPALAEKKETLFE
jgi:hypothetical protein